MVSKRKSRSKGKPKAENGKKERDQDTIRQINAALDADPVLYQIWTLLQPDCALTSNIASTLTDM